MMILGAAGAAVFGGLYGLACFHTPVVYFRLVLLFLFSGMLGCTVAQGAQWSRIAGKRVILLGAFLAGLAGAYASWVFWILALSKYKTFLWEPARLFRAMEKLSEYDLWSLFGWTPHGWDYYGVWALEAIAFITVVLFVAGRSMSFAKVLVRAVEAVTGRPYGK
jgi:hypothetical protein